MDQTIKRVVCIDASPAGCGLEKEKTYTVLEDQGHYYALAETADMGGWLKTRFRDVPVKASRATAPDWFALYLSGDKQARKQAPIARGLLQYFPNTCINVAHVSYVANEQHNPGLPLQWAFDKSSDEADCQLRHAIDAAANPVDDDQLLHLAKKAWRAFAECERYLLEKYPNAQPGASVTGFVRGSK